MLILLPPSEGKNEAQSSVQLELSQLRFASELRQARQQVISRHDPKLFEAMTNPAIEIYSGVLYQALDWQSLSPAAKKRGSRELLIISAIYGVVAPTDHIAHYKAKMKSSDWKSALTPALDAIDTTLIVDCRSSTYAGVWRPAPDKTVAIRVFQEKAGERSVITHMSKKYRGELTRLLLSNKSVSTPDELAALANQQFRTELAEPVAGESWYLDLIIPVG
jgi:cytoplasmic iron level regulating protein YaaA (DUF328/UPF0246 family)